MSDALETTAMFAGIIVGLGLTVLWAAVVERAIVAIHALPVERWVEEATR